MNARACFLGLISAFGLAAAVYGQTLQQDLEALESLRKGLETPLDVVDERGAAMLKKYERPQDQAQILYQLAHVHAQSGVRQPEQILKYAGAALETKLLTPSQRATMFSYLASAHEVDKETKDFATRRRKAVARLLAGLAELEAFKLPAVAPEPPPGVIENVDSPDAGEVARIRVRAEAAQRARAEAERIRNLIFLRQVLKDQVKWLYYRDPVADDELTELATKAVGKELAAQLLAAAKAEREKIEKDRAEREGK